MFTAGILLPRSTLFPSLNLDILNGMKEYLKQEQVWDSIKLVTDNIGFGIDEQEVYTKAEKMLLQDDADLVILCADTRITEMLHPLFAAANKLLLVVNFGANFPESWQPGATTIVHSLNFCLHAGITGKMAATENERKEAVNLVSYYDGGYRQCYSMLNTHQLHGGLPVFNHITALQLKEFTLAPYMAFLEEHAEVKTALCLFAGEQAQCFYQEITPLQKKYGLKLYGSPMLFEPSLKAALGEQFSIQEMKGYIPWHHSLVNDANTTFLNCFNTKNGKKADYFTLIGWEASMLIKGMMEEHNSGNKEAAKVIQSLSERVFKSPRGWMKIDGPTHHSYGPSWLAVCSGNMDITIQGEANTEEEWKTFISLPTLQGESSGWRNTYLCI